MKHNNEPEGEGISADSLDLIGANSEMERLKFVEQVGDEKLSKLTAKEWAGFVSVYLVEAAHTEIPQHGEEGVGAAIAHQRHMLLKAYAILNEAMRRHVSMTGFPVIASVELDKAKQEPKIRLL